MSDFWIHVADGRVRAHYQHFNDNLTVPDTYVCTTLTKNDDGSISVASKIISKNAYLQALDYALNH